eukprot:c13704_g1_i1 orf=134-1201(+)
MTTHREKQEEMSTSKEKQYMQSPGNVPCSICLDAVESVGDRSIARLKCGHHFHLDCIGSAFNAKGAMQCPNCRQVEGGQWLFASGCYLQQHVLQNTNSDEDPGIHLNMVYRYDERASHTNRRPPHGTYRQISVESDYPSSTNRWRGAAPREVIPWNVPLNEIARPPASDLDPSHIAGTYEHSSQPMVTHRAPLHGSVLPVPDPSHLLEGPNSRQRMDEDGFFSQYEATAGLASGRRHATNRGANERGIAFNLQILPERIQGPLSSLEQSMSSRFQDARFGPAGSDTYNTRRVGAYAASHIPIGREWGSSIHHQDTSRRSFVNAYIGDVHHLHSLNRAVNPHSYDGHQLRARTRWM